MNKSFRKFDEHHLQMLAEYLFDDWNFGSGDKYAAELLKVVEQERSEKASLRAVTGREFDAKVCSIQVRTLDDIMSGQEYSGILNEGEAILLIHDIATRFDAENSDGKKEIMKLVMPFIVEHFSSSAAVAFIKIIGSNYCFRDLQGMPEFHSFARAFSDELRFSIRKVK